MKLKELNEDPQQRELCFLPVAVVRTRPKAMPLAMITMRKSTHGFPFLSYMSMGLRLVVLRAAGAPLLLSVLKSCVNRFYSFFATIFTLGKRSEAYDFTTGKRNISRSFGNMITLMQLLINFRQVVTSNGTILTFWRPARLTTTVSSEKRLLY